MRTLFELPSMVQRALELQASWILKRTQLSVSGAFMVKAAEQAARARPSVKSCFFADKKNRLVQQVLAHEVPNCSWHRHVQQCRVDFRVQEMHTARSKKPEQAMTIAPEPRLTSRLIDTIPDQQMRQQLTLWALRKLMGKPVPCNNCNGKRVTILHVQACVAVLTPIHGYLRAGRPLGALKKILKMQMVCLGLDCRRVMDRIV